MTQRIVIAAKPKESFTLDLVGVEYLISTPKSTIAIALAERTKDMSNDPSALMRELAIWITAAFGAKQAPKVLKRLNDPADELDVPEIMELMTKLAEAGTPNPST